MSLDFTRMYPNPHEEKSASENSCVISSVDLLDLHLSKHLNIKSF